MLGASEDTTGILVWQATASTCKPICVAGSEGLNLSVYHHEGQIVGLTVFDNDGLVTAIGSIPAEVYLEDLNERV